MTGPADRAPAWRLEGYDTFAGEAYPIDGAYGDEEQTRAAARRYLAELEETQPTDQSGGQADGGIQDRVYVLRPDGTRYRFVG